MNASGIAQAVRGARSNFYMPMRLMPKAPRAAIFAIYAFARALDDIADGVEPRAAKHAALDRWRCELDTVYHGHPTTPIGVALADAVARYALPREELDALIDGMAMDVDGDLRAPPQATLDLYCRRAAGTIGVLAISIFGCNAAPERRFAIALGRAFQLTNIARDLAEDAGRGRIYVPREVFARLGIGDDVAPETLPQHPRFAEIRRDLCALAESAYGEADAALAECRSRRRLWPALAMMGIYRRVLAKLAAAAGGPRVRIARPMQLAIALRALVLARA